MFPLSRDPAVLTPKGMLCQRFKYPGDRQPLLGARLALGLLWRVSQVGVIPTPACGEIFCPAPPGSRILET